MYYSIEAYYNGLWFMKCWEINKENAKQTLNEYKKSFKEVPFRIKRRYGNPA